MFDLMVSSPEKEGIFYASKWVHVPVFAAISELKELFSFWEKARLFLIGTALKKENTAVSFSSFLQGYEELLEQLKKGIIPDREACKKILPLAATLVPEALYLQPLSEEKYIVKVIKPVVQIQAHFFRYSPLDSSFRSQVMGKESIFWGLNFSYPGLFEDPKTGEIQKESANAPLFHHFRKWVRDFTLPTPFILPSGEKKNVSFRLGKELFSWISSHPSLKEQNLQVEAL